MEISSGLLQLEIAGDGVEERRQQELQVRCFESVTCCSLIQYNTYGSQFRERLNLLKKMPFLKPPSLRGRLLFR